MSSNLYLITGEDAYEKQEKLEQIKADFGECVKGINYIVLDKTNMNKLEDEINTYPFGFSSKLIIVKVDKKEKVSEATDGANEGEASENVEDKNDWLTPSLEETLKNLEGVTVVLFGDIKKTTRIYKLVQKHGECLVCDKKKEYDLLSWSSKIFKENSVDINNADINYLINLCGTDKLMLKNEIDKLIDFSFESKRITKEDIDAICIRTSDVIIFDLTDSIGNKNTKAALLQKKFSHTSTASTTTRTALTGATLFPTRSLLSQACSAAKATTENPYASRYRRASTPTATALPSAPSSV